MRLPGATLRGVGEWKSIRWAAQPPWPGRHWRGVNWWGQRTGWRARHGPVGNHFALASTGQGDIPGSGGSSCIASGHCFNLVDIGSRPSSACSVRGQQVWFAGLRPCHGPSA